MGHSCGTLLWDTFVGHSCRTLLPDTLAGHPYGTPLWDSIVGHCRIMLWDTSSLQSERFVRDFLQINASFRTRLPQKLTFRVCKTSVSYETSSKSHVSSLQTERFVRNFLQKSGRKPHRSTHIKQPCQAVSRLQPLQTTTAHTPIIPMSQRHSPPPQLATSRFPAPATNIYVSTRLTRTKYGPCHEMSPPPHLATSLFPAPATKIALPYPKARTKYCACH